MFIFEKEVLCSLLTIFFLTFYFSPAKLRNFYVKFALFASKEQMMEIENESSDSENVALLGEEKPESKYEDKYLENIKKMNMDFIFDENEKELEKSKTNEFFLLAKNEYYEKIKEIKFQLGYIETQLAEYREYDYCNIEKYCENDCGCELKNLCDSNLESDLKKTNEIIVNRLTVESLDLEKSLSEIYDIIDTDEGLSKLNKLAQEKAIKFVIDERFDKLKNNLVMEKTPLGNVLMLYNNKRGSFEYYSDNTIPYRYLESVGRKYVKTFNCRQIYFIMEEELKKYEMRLEEKDNEEKEKELKRKRDEEENKNNIVPLVEPKKNVFAKFKSYNKEAGTGHVNTAAPPKNSIPNNKVTETNSNQKVLLKENANRYSYEGKISNFNFLKKIDRKVIDKKYAMTFADFKRMQEVKNKI
jgi:hypothetical protein